jgi:hypothetical protein
LLDMSPRTYGGEHLAETQVEATFYEALEGWDAAVERHVLAPPDAGFSDRLASLAASGHIQAERCRLAHAKGFKWEPAMGTPVAPWELQPESGRRGPTELWRIFDAACAEFARAGRGTDLLVMGAAFDRLADAAGDLATAIARADRESGLLPRHTRST